MSERSGEDRGTREVVVRGGETFTPVEGYAAELGYLSEEEFISELGSGKVLDIGSGLGGLAKSAAFKLLPCTVYSVNPRLKDKGHRKNEKKATRAYVLGQLTSQGKEPGGVFSKLIGRSRKWQKQAEQVISRVQEAHDGFARWASVYELSFGDDFFDLVIDNQAVSKYTSRFPYDNVATEEERVRFKQAIEEMLRVLKSGGKIRIGDCDYGYGEKDGEPISWKEQTLKELGLEYQLIKVKPKRQVVPFLLQQDGTLVTGVEIVKR